MAYQQNTSRRGISTTLTAEVFKDVISALRSDESSTRLLDKRSSPRVGLRTKLAIVTGPTGPFEAAPVDVWLRDLSSGGIGIVHNQELEPGAAFVAHLPRRQGPPLRVLYEVAHCKRLAKDLYSIGAKLNRILS
ncbi:MAG TPA: PilZ domain-containing protein [Tepidisphaeraceae bacterium]|nr:PilZ domain-containing protein [Tepidisphaeraceae bacterium]